MDAGGWGLSLSLFIPPPCPTQMERNSSPIGRYGIPIHEISEEMRVWKNGGSEVNFLSKNFGQTTDPHSPLLSTPLLLLLLSPPFSFTFWSPLLLYTCTDSFPFFALFFPSSFLSFLSPAATNAADNNAMLAFYRGLRSLGGLTFNTLSFCDVPNVNLTTIDCTAAGRVSGM